MPGASKEHNYDNEIIPIYVDPTTQSTEQDGSDYGEDQITGWDLARDFFGAIDPLELGPLTGSGLSFLQIIDTILQAYALSCGSYCLENPWIRQGVSLFIPVASTIAVIYDYSYDQVTNTGPYSSEPPRGSPPWSSLTTFQKIMRVAAPIIVIAIVIPVIPP